MMQRELRKTIGVASQGRQAETLEHKHIFREELL